MSARRTLWWSVEANIEFLHIVVDERDFIVRHEPGSPGQSDGVDGDDDAHIFITSVSMRRLLGAAY